VPNKARSAARNAYVAEKKKHIAVSTRSARRAPLELMTTLPHSECSMLR
jgi:hypothetical protein